MFFSPLSLVHKYDGVQARLERAFAFLAGLKSEGLLPGSVIEIDGRQLYANVGGYSTGEAAERRFEAHDAYADVHFVLRGEERIDVAPRGGLAVIEAYDAARDIVFLQSPETFCSLVLRPDDALVLFPEEAHRPGCLVHEPCDVLKLVVKVALVS